MGVLVEGQWQDQGSVTPSSNKGRFVRKESQFRNWVTADGSAGPSGEAGFRAEPGRYHLYVGHACPWAHRTVIYRALKGLEEAISLSIVHWFMGEQGWTFEETAGTQPDPINGADYIHQVYTAARPAYSGRAAIPVLWDRKEATIVSNESSEIIRMLNSAFDAVGAREGDYYPEAKRDEIGALNALIYDTVNNGVYKCGFATSQEAYEESLAPLFETLDELENRLNNQRFLTGSDQSEADWRLFTTLVRFDPVYVGHFKCNLKRIADYPNLSAYLRDLYQQPGVAATVNMEHIKAHYYGSHLSINPTGVIPEGPQIDYDASHERARLS